MVWSKPRGKSINKRGIPAETKPGHKLYGSRKREDMTGIRSRPTTMGKGNGIRTFQGWWWWPRAPLNRIRIEVALPPIYLSMYLPHNLALLTRNWIWLGNCVFCHWWMVVSRLLANCIARFSFPFVAKMPSIHGLVDRQLIGWRRRIPNLFWTLSTNNSFCLTCRVCLSWLPNFIVYIYIYTYMCGKNKT